MYLVVQRPLPNLVGSMTSRFEGLANASSIDCSLLACSLREEEGELNVRWDDDYRNLWQAAREFLPCVSYSLTPLSRVRPLLCTGACLSHGHANDRRLGVHSGEPQDDARSGWRRLQDLPSDPGRASAPSTRRGIALCRMRPWAHAGSGSHHHTGRKACSPPLPWEPGLWHAHCLGQGGSARCTGWRRRHMPACRAHTRRT